MRVSAAEGLRTRRCAVMGCESLVEQAGDVCGRCAEELDALELWNREREAGQICKYLRRRDRAEKLRAAARWVWRAIWLPEMLLVAACCLYIGWEIGKAFWACVGVR